MFLKCLWQFLDSLWTILSVGLPAEAPEPRTELTQDGVLQELDQAKLIATGLRMGEECLLRETLAQNITDLTHDTE